MHISLHHLTIQDASLTEMADIAAATGYDSVCLFIKIPNDLGNFPRVNSVAEASELRKRLDGHGLSAWNTDTCMIGPDIAAADYDQSLEVAAALGARTFNIISMEPDFDAAADKLGALAEMAAKVGVQPIFEWFRRSEVRTLKDSLDLIARTGRDDIELNVDVLHLIRNGELPADLAKVPARMKRYAQINDGPLVQPEKRQAREAVSDRDFPGAGEFPLVDFVRQIPEDAVLCVEAPVMRLAGQMSPTERAQRHIDCTRQVLAAAGR